MTNEKNDQQKITEAGAVELEEGALDQASGGLNFSKIEVDRRAPTSSKI
jgi:hypothetical protein